MKGWFANAGWILVGLLVLAGAMISAGRREYVTNPSSDSFFPSGTSALKQLLIHRGYRVRVDRSPDPALQPGDIALEFYFPENPIEDKEAPSDSGKAIIKVREAVAGGAVVVMLPLSNSVSDGANPALNVEAVQRLDGASRSVTTDPSAFNGMYQQNDSTSMRTLLRDKQNGFVSLGSRGKGMIVAYGSGLGLTNWYIDKYDNAQVLLETLAAIAPPNAQIVLPEATFGNVRSRGLLESIGEWAEAGWYQILFLFAAVVYTLNRRFGLPEEYRPVQRGTRELLDAVTDTYTRSHAYAAALLAAVQIADTRLRNALKLPRDASPRERDRLLPESLVKSLAMAQAAAHLDTTREGQAFQIAKKLETDVSAFLSDRNKVAPSMGRVRRAARI